MMKERRRATEHWNRLPDQLEWDDVGGRLLANLARGIYSHEDVLREYVQNASDAYKVMKSPPDDQSIIITPDGNDLRIYDSGIGMNEKAIRDAKKIAVSTKEEQEDAAGFRGIGIWAGFIACNQLIVDSTMAGDTRRFRLVIDFEEILKHIDDNINIKKLIDPCYRIEFTTATADEHFTQITLKNITRDYRKLLDPTELIRIASQVLPARVDPDFSHYDRLQAILETWPSYHELPIKVRTKEGLEEVFREFPGEVEEPQEVILKTADGTELGRAWHCRTKKTSREITAQGNETRGFRLRVKNIAVGGINKFDEEKGYSYGIEKNLDLNTTARLKWYCGEIHVTNQAVRPNTPRNDLEHDNIARMLIESVRGYYRERISEAGAYSNFNPYRDALTDCEAIIKKYQASGIPANDPIADKARKLLDRLEKAAHDTKGSSGDEEKSLLKTLLRQKWFKDRSKSLTHQLKSLLPQTTEPEPKAQPTGKTKSASTNGDKTEPSPKKKAKGAAETAKASDPSMGSATITPAAAESLLSDIFDVIDDWLGGDFEDLAPLKEAIQNLYYERLGINAAE